MKKGFTLIELLAVITILGVLGLIATVTINNNIKESNEKAYNMNIEYIIKGARNWAGKHVFELPENDGEFVIVTLGQLKNDGFVDGNITNPLTKELFDNNMQIKIIKENNNYNFEIIE